MSITQQVKAELAKLEVLKPKTRRSELASLLRFAGGLHLVQRQIVVEAELDLEITAYRVRKSIKDLYGFNSDLVVVSGSGLRRGTRYVVRLIKDGETLAKQIGLLDARRRPVRGLPSAIVTGSLQDAAAAWRGAFLAQGTLTEPGRAMALEVACPSSESALALVGAARRLGVQCKAREVRGGDRVVIRDGDMIANMLGQLEAWSALNYWNDRRKEREVRANTNRLANFDDANLRRSARAAVTAGVRVKRALEILGDDVPAHLRTAGLLRIENQQASLEELGLLHVPPLTKDAVAGRIRRLLATADRKAKELGIPDTMASLNESLLDDFSS